MVPLDLMGELVTPAPSYDAPAQIQSDELYNYKIKTYIYFIVVFN